tara:strand:- start:1251 stop:1880 length:630 start_codon:yes stop_codon:yes gene_type:complete
MSELLQNVLSFLGGGVLLGILTWIISNRKDKREGLQQVIDNYKDDNKRLRDEFSELKKAFEKEKGERNHIELQLRSEVMQLRNKLLIMESAHLDLPVPQWLKDVDGTMLAINKAYESTFLEPMDKEASDYIGKTDKDVWDKATAESFASNDRIVMRSKKPFQTQESINLENHIEVWEILKYPRFSGNTLIGIGGIAFKRIKDQTTSART